jgi:8-oxo-dGTP pyrophosphatase MutT (NUDIX family)
MPESPAFRLSSAVFVQREGQILVLKRAVGEAVGMWYLPGGALDEGERIEDCARRELQEEAGLTVTGPMTAVAVAHLHVYGQDSLQVLYACDCADGDVTISHEHAAFRWIDPVAYRDRYFSDDVITNVLAANPRAGEMLANLRQALDAYLSWRARQP